LRELRISKQQSADWQKIAAIPAAEFERRIEAASGDPQKLRNAEILGTPPQRRGVTMPCPHCAGTGRLTAPVTARPE
jgi:hypothetical protein